MVQVPIWFTSWFSHLLKSGLGNLWPTWTNIQYAPHHQNFRYSG